MCIRDSGYGARLFDRAVMHARNQGVTMIFIHALTENTTMPVSYTHLRAHETVLDLVCRLLLEKKKIDSTDAIILMDYVVS